MKEKEVKKKQVKKKYQYSEPTCDKASKYNDEVEDDSCVEDKEYR